jgi:hypothetical protein
VVSEHFLRDVKEQLLRDFRIDHDDSVQHAVCEVAHGCA